MSAYIFMQLHSQAIPQDLTYYDAFTLPEMPEPATNNVKVVVQTPVTYTIDGLDATAQDDDDAVTEPARLSKRTTRACLFYLIPALSLVCIFIYAMEMIAISRADNNGLPEGMDQKYGVTMTPTDYYEWISKKKHMLQDKNSGNDDASLTVKNHIWTWVGASVLASSILILLVARVMLMLKKKCSSCCTTSMDQPKPSTCATAGAQAKKSKKKKHHHYHQTRNPILMGSLVMGMMGTWIIFMDQVALAYGKPVGQSHPITDHSAVSCLMKDPADPGTEYLTSCEVTTTTSSEACPILKASCEDHICQHLVLNSTDITQPPKLDKLCYYPNPAEPPCMQHTVTCSDSFPLPTFQNMKLVICIIISFIVILFLGMTGLLYHMAHLHLTMMQSLWSEGVTSKYYTMTEANGHPKPTWGRLMRDTYCLWTTNIYLPYFQTPWICMECFSEPSPRAFADDNDDIPEEDRHPLAEDDLSPDLAIQNHDPLSNTASSSSSSAGFVEQDVNERQGACGNVGRVHPTIRRATVAEGHEHQASFVAQQWKSMDQHLEDGRNSLKNSNFYRSAELLSSDEEVLICSSSTQQPVVVTTTLHNITPGNKKDVAESPLSKQYNYF